MEIKFTEPVLMYEFSGPKFYELLLTCEFHIPNAVFGSYAISKYSTMNWICDDCWLEGLHRLRGHKRRHG